MVKIPSGLLEKSAAVEVKFIAGVDEVGKGCVAGPVYAAAVVLNISKLNEIKSCDRSLIRDSKTLSTRQRQKSIDIIKNIALSIAVSFADMREIEDIGIQDATFLAMRRAVKNLNHRVDLLLVDGRFTLPLYKLQQQAIVKGDQLSFSIAAASVVAKETRDNYMREQAKEYPLYGFDAHVGYGTKRHIENITSHGPCVLHRKNFEPIKSMLDVTHLNN